MGQLDVALAGGATPPAVTSRPPDFCGVAAGRVHASLLVPYSTLALCCGGAHYWARRDERLTRHRCCLALALITAAPPQQRASVL